MSNLAKTASRVRLWEQWAPARLASIDRQIAAAKGPVRDDRQFSLAVWNATVEGLFIRLAQHDDIKRGAGPVRFWLALSSFRNTREHEPNEKAECRVRTSVRDFQTGKIEPGPLADRCGLHPSTIDHYLPWLRDDDDLETGKARKDSLKILTVTQSRGDRQGASSYDWSLDFPSIVMAMAKPNRGSKRPIEWPFRLSSRVVVAAFLVKKMKRTEGRVSLRRRDLAATGLDVDAAHKALDWLLAEGFFIKVGDGVAALPEMVTAGVYGKVEGRFWDRKSNRPEGQSAEAKTRSARPDRTVRKTRQNGSEDQTESGLEGLSDGPSGRPDIEQREVDLNLREEFKRQEGENYDDDITAVTHQLSKSELREPASSDGRRPSPSSGQLSSSSGAARPTPSQEAIAMITRAMEAPGAGIEAQDELIAQVWLAIEHAHGGNLRASSPGERLHTFAKERRYGGMSDETVQGWRVLRERLTPADVARIVARVNEAIGADPPWPDTAVLPMIGPKIVRAQKMGRDFDWVLRSFKDPGNWPIQSRPPFSVADFGRMATTALKAAEAALAVGNRGAADVNRDA